MEYITKDGRTLSPKQVKVLLYNNFDLTSIKDISYKEVSNRIGEFIEEFKEQELSYGYESLDEFGQWDCPIDPWGN